MAQKSPKKEERIFYQALEKSPEQREAFLKEVCGNDQELYKRVEALLKASDLQDDFLRRRVRQVGIFCTHPEFGQDAGMVITSRSLRTQRG